MSSDPNVVSLTPAPLSTGGWWGRLQGRFTTAPSRQSLVMGGSLIMLIGTGLVSAFNFAYNVSMARLLGPAQFGNVSAMATLLMLCSAIGLSFQLVCAKFVARNQHSGLAGTIYDGLMKRAWLVALAVGCSLLALSSPITRLLRLPSALLVMILAIGIAFSVPLGVKRGALQGLCSFAPLSGNFIVESLTKLVAALLLVWLGYGVYGAVGAISASVLAAFLFTRLGLRTRATGEMEAAPFRAYFQEGMQAIVFFIGQVVINNIDILLVKYYFDAEQAGLYAAVALFGRLLYFACWSIVSAMFPVSAASPRDERPSQVLKTPLMLVGGLSAVFIITETLLPRFVVGLVLGQQFAHADELLGIYATATAIYAVSVVLIAYEMSRRLANTGWLQLVISGMTVLGIALFHSSLHQVIVVQIVTMLILLLLVSMPFLRGTSRETVDRSTSTQARSAAATASARARAEAAGIHVVRPVTEAEAIGEFLKNEFYEADYNRDRDDWEELVLHPDYSNEEENATRRALLFRRRGHMWRELPPDTQWFEVKLSPEDLDKIHVFPRAQWSKISNGSYCIGDVVRRIRERNYRDGGDRVIAKIQQMRYRLQIDPHSTSTVLLIGQDEKSPVTILEGNHRLSAAMLVGPEVASTRFRVFCGFSPRMTESCWYRTNVPNLWRYAKNRFTHIVDRDADVSRFLPARRPQSETGPAAMATVAGESLTDPRG
jgi:O-antigen/teichoic acid export membrane protein